MLPQKAAKVSKVNKSPASPKTQQPNPKASPKKSVPKVKVVPKKESPQPTVPSKPAPAGNASQLPPPTASKKLPNGEIMIGDFFVTENEISLRQGGHRFLNLKIFMTKQK